MYASTPRGRFPPFDVLAGVALDLSVALNCALGVEVRKITLYREGPEDGVGGLVVQLPCLQSLVVFSFLRLGVHRVQTLPRSGL